MPVTSNLEAACPLYLWQALAASHPAQEPKPAPTQPTGMVGGAQGPGPLGQAGRARDRKG